MHLECCFNFSCIKFLIVVGIFFRLNSLVLPRLGLVKDKRRDYIPVLGNQLSNCSNLIIDTCTCDLI